MSKVKQPLTKQEKKVMDLLLRADSEFSKLDEGLPGQSGEWKALIHKAQSVLFGRVLVRDYPEHFSYKKRVG